MRKALRRQNKRRVSTLKNRAGPIGGWDLSARSKEAGITVAFELQNFIPEVGKVTFRKGSEDHVTGITGPVGTLMEYTFGTTSKLFASTATDIYDVTAAGAVGAAVLSSLTNGIWASINFSTTGGNFLCLVNGADGFRTYDGSSWVTETITGATAADMIDLFAHKERIWMIEKNSLSCWYLAPRAKSGAAVEFDIGSVVTKGGHIVAGASWSFDGGSGPDDYWDIDTSEGEVVVYTGVDPGTAQTWQLAGVYQIDKPVGRRCILNAGSDLVVLTESGTIPMSQIQVSVSGRDMVPDAIRDPFIAASQRVAGTVPGWQLFLYRRKGWLYANIPFTDGSRQYAMNTVTKKWFEIQGWDADCWGALESDLFFAIPDGTIVRADSSFAERGNDIVGRILTGWDDFGTDYVKHWKMVRPLQDASEVFIPLIKMQSDYNLDNVGGVAGSFAAVEGSTWDVAVWDVAEWITTSQGRSRWYGVGGAGMVGSILYECRLKNISLSISGWDVLFERGDVL
jgi:hypothetical protein